MDAQIVMKTKLIMVPLSQGCLIEGAQLGIQPIQDAIKQTNMQCETVELAIPDQKNNIQLIADVCNQVAAEMMQSYQRQQFPIVVGGDHALGIGSVAAASTRKNVGILWFDAHGDINTPETTPSFHIHGMPLAISLGYGYPKLVNCLENRIKLQNEQIVYLGTRDLDAGEQAYIEQQNISIITTAAIKEMGLAKTLEQLDAYLAAFDTIHISLDLDVMDPEQFPSVNLGVQNGISKQDVFTVLHHLFMNHAICSCDVVEYNPLHDKQGDVHTVVELLSMMADYAKRKELQEV